MGIDKESIESILDWHDRPPTWYPIKTVSGEVLEISAESWENKDRGYMLTKNSILFRLPDGIDDGKL